MDLNGIINVRNKRINMLMDGRTDRQTKGKRNGWVGGDLVCGRIYG